MHARATAITLASVGPAGPVPVALTWHSFFASLVRLPALGVGKGCVQPECWPQTWWHVGCRGMARPISLGCVRARVLIRMCWSCVRAWTCGSDCIPVHGLQVAAGCGSGAQRSQRLVPAGCLRGVLRGVLLQHGAAVAGPGGGGGAGGGGQGAESVCLLACLGATQPQQG
jgi:hypothetical protein